MKRLIPILCAVAMLWPQRARSHETLTTTVLFDREIVHVLNQHCVMCHVENGPAFPLETYEQTWLRKRPIRAEVIARHMPPWPAVPGYGQFANDNSLTLRETQFIVSWVEGLGPRNAGTVFTNVAAAAAAPKDIRAHMDFSRWQLGEPSLKLKVTAKTIETGLKSPRWLHGLEYMPADRRDVRAVFFTVQETGQWIGSWTPWYGHVNLPKGAAYRLPAGAHIAAEIHSRSGKMDPGTLGLFFVDQPPANAVSDLILESTTPTAPGKFRAASKLMSDASILALRPEIQPGMTSVEVSARKPDGTTVVLLFAKDFQLDWPTPFILKDAVALPKGTELAATAYYASGAAPNGIRVTVGQVSGLH